MGGNPAGVPLGGVCQRLYVDLNQPYLTLVGVADAFGETTFRFGQVPWQPGYAGVDLWTQGAYSDSGTGRFSLTMSGFARVPARQQNIHRRAASWGLGASALIGTEPDPSAVVCPLMLFTYR